MDKANFQKEEVSLKMSMLNMSHDSKCSCEQTFLKGESGMKKTILCLLVILSLVIVPALAANPVVVATDSTGDFLTIQAAISSWCAGGTNASATAPFVIRIKPGTYEEKLSLYDSKVGRGDIVGDIKIQAYDTTNQPIIKVMVSDTTWATTTTVTRQGFMINQSVNNVELRDLIFTYSLISSTSSDFGGVLGSMGYVAGPLIKVDETAPNASSNTVAIYNCVFATPDTTGNPVVTSKAQALSGYYWSAKTAAIAGGTLLQMWGDVGESMNGIIQNCVFYGSSSYGINAHADGSSPETITVKDCLIKDMGYYATQFGCTNPNGKIIITGTKESKYNDLYSSTVVLNSGIGGTGGHLFYLSGASTNIDISNVIGYSIQTIVRGISGSTHWIKVKNSLIVSTLYGIVHNHTSGHTFSAESCTFLSPYGPKAGTIGSGSLYYAGAGTNDTTGGLISFKDCVFGGGTTSSKFGGGTTFSAFSANIQFTNVAFPTTGSYAIAYIAALGGSFLGIDSAQTNLSTAIYDDPGFSSVDPTSVDFLAITNSAYLGKSSNGGVLLGGGHYKSSLGLAAPAVVTMGQSISISALNGVAPYTWISSDTTKGTITGTGATVTFNAIALGSTLVTVTDSALGSASQTINIVGTAAPLATELFE
jgi:hypothetical protein